MEGGSFAWKGREEESRRRGKCHRRAARLGRAAEVAARRPADDNLRVGADQRIRRVAALEALDEAGAAVAAHALTVIHVLALAGAAVVAVVAVVAPDVAAVLDALLAVGAPVPDSAIARWARHAPVRPWRHQLGGSWVSSHWATAARGAWQKSRGARRGRAIGGGLGRFVGTRVGDGLFPGARPTNAPVALKSGAKLARFDCCVCARLAGLLADAECSHCVSRGLRINQTPACCFA